MNTELLTQIFELIIIPLLGILVSFLVAYLKSKRDLCIANMDNETKKKYLTMLTNTISDCVLATNQTYVEALKKEGKFDALAQKNAFEKTKDAVLAILSEEAKVYLISALGDLDAYLDTKIEAEVNICK